GTRVTYLADEEIPDVIEVFVAPVDGSAPALRLNGPFGTYAIAGDVAALQVSSDGRYAVYGADQDVDEVHELYSVALPERAGDPIPAPVRLTPLDHVTGSAFGGEFRISPDGARVVYRSNRDAPVPSGFELFSVPIDGSAPPVALHPPLAAGGSVTA